MGLHTGDAGLVEQVAAEFENALESLAEQLRELASRFQGDSVTAGAAAKTTVVGEKHKAVAGRDGAAINGFEADPPTKKENEESHTTL